MPSPEEFFEGLIRCGWKPVPGKTAGNIRFEVTRGRGSEHWRVGVDRNSVQVFRDDAEVDCVVRADWTLLDGVIGGRVNAMAAMLRGALTIEGDPELLVLIQRLCSARPIVNGVRLMADSGR